MKKFIVMICSSCDFEGEIIFIDEVPDPTYCPCCGTDDPDYLEIAGIGYVI